MIALLADPDYELYPLEEIEEYEHAYARGYLA
jgi:hypothetical protein